VKEKLQTPAQRVANAVWLRDQIARLITSCDERIEEDERLAAWARGDEGALVRARIEFHEHWRRQLQRILRGKTLAEDLRTTIEKASP
jgi:hypothetical protein